MTSNGPPRSPLEDESDLTPALDILLQVVRELEGLAKLENLVPSELLWDRPPGLPSGAELLWLVHLVDAHVFLPAIDAARSSDRDDLSAPDYRALLEAFPCNVDTLDDLLSRIRESRTELIDRLRSLAAARSASDATPRAIVDTIVAHDRRLLSAFTERLYESGLGA